MWIWKWIKKWFTPKEEVKPEPKKPEIDLTGLTKGDMKEIESTRKTIMDLDTFRSMTEAEKVNFKKRYGKT